MKKMKRVYPRKAENRKIYKKECRQTPQIILLFVTQTPPLSAVTVRAAAAPVPPRTGASFSALSVPEDDRAPTHQTILRRGHDPLKTIVRCSTCCDKYHCTYCTMAQNHLHEAQNHVANHLRNAVERQDFVIMKCGLSCRQTPHFHCCYCMATLIRRDGLIKHLTTCKNVSSRQPPSIVPAAAPPQSHPSLAEEPSSLARAPPSSEEPHRPAEEPHCPSEEPHCPSEEPHCPSEEPLCPAEEPHCPSEEPHCPSEEPLCPAEEPRCPSDEPQNSAEEPQCPSEEPQSQSDEPQSSGEEPVCPLDEPQSSAEELQCPSDEPQSSAEEPQSQSDEPQNSAEEPQCSAEELSSQTEEPQCPAEEPQCPAGTPSSTAKQPSSAAVRAQIQQQVRVACTHCGIQIIERNLLVHMNRKHRPCPTHQTILRRGHDPLKTIVRCSTCCDKYHCTYCTMVRNHLHEAQNHVANHVQNAVKHEDFVIMKCGLSCRQTPHFHCCYCTSTLIRRDGLIKHLTACKSVSSGQAPPITPIPQSHPSQPEELTFPVKRPPCAAKAPLPSAEEPPRPSSAPSAPSTAVRKRVQKQVRVACAHCGIQINKRNLLVHISRKHRNTVLLGK